MRCSFGAAPSTLIPTPKPINTNFVTAGNIMDHAPLVNVPTFGMCSCPANPTVAAATTAAMGVLTPMPCIPNTPAPWLPGKITILLQNFPALDDGATLQCVYGGAIQFVSAAQANHQIDDQAGSAGGGMAAAVFAPAGGPPPTPASAPAPAASAPAPAASALSPAASTRSTLAAPATPQQAPARVDLSPMQSDYNQLWSQSFPNGQSQEHGGTIVSDPSGKLSLINTGGGQSGSFGPNLATGPNQSVTGIFHTHPYDASEGGYTGVSLSGGDAAYMINQKQDVIVAQSGSDQFMYMRTQASPASVNAAALNNAQNARIGVLQGQGMGFSDASRQAARETATQYNLAYYEGSNGVLNRVVP